ncbi:MAG: VanZ family protein [Lachnospiraceae bacterium]|mgnify:CR=1 FL=1|uniref:VanZ family protein n=1 Tax=uncultured Acetatifactor sp. TaxID=1671927 RepID=UPI00260EC684|nr:VanZ family protein [uncultured Acetatifactor sp.]MCI8788616.1 VanZ family protein [Lachnospiraceae bacterium]
MFKHIYRDMMSMVKHLPYGFLIGLPVATLLLWAMDRARRRKGEPPVSKLPVAAFGIYLSMMLVITFLSRESGNSKGFDLELFSTWGINDRNNAYVIENIMLFVPYGFLGSWAFEKMGNFFRCLALGALTSLCIESLQLVTGRGFFQIDDILTNTLGAVIGCLVYRLFLFCGKK